MISIPDETLQRFTQPSPFAGKVAYLVNKSSSVGQRALLEFWAEHQQSPLFLVMDVRCVSADGKHAIDAVWTACDVMPPPQDGEGWRRSVSDARHAIPPMVQE